MKRVVMFVFCFCAAPTMNAQSWLSSRCIISTDSDIKSIKAYIYSLEGVCDEKSEIEIDTSKHNLRESEYFEKDNRIIKSVSNDGVITEYFYSSERLISKLKRNSEDTISTTHYLLLENNLTEVVNINHKSKKRSKLYLQNDTLGNTLNSYRLNQNGDTVYIRYFFYDEAGLLLSMSSYEYGKLVAKSNRTFNKINNDWIQKIDSNGNIFLSCINRSNDCVCWYYKIKYYEINN